MPAPLSGGRPQVVIVGAGFGGLRAARVLGNRAADVLLFDRNNYHCFQPLLYQVATAGLDADQIAHPVRAIVRRHHNVRFIMARVERVNLERQAVTTAHGDVHYDYLVLAAGSATNYFGLDSVRARAFELKDLDHAVGLRNHILTLFERAAAETNMARRRELLTFCVVGGGPTGVEFAGALSELIRLVLVKDYPGLDLSAVQILLLESGPELLQALSKKLQESAAATLLRKHVTVRLGAKVTGMEEAQVRLEDGTSIPSRTLLWAAGVRGSALAETLGVTLARGQRVAVEPTLQLPGHPNVYVIGDLAFLLDRGQPVPMLAPVAVQMGEKAARNILATIRGRTARPFRYRDPGTLATIGRNQAVARLGGFEFTGFVAWWVWLFVHLMNLVGFRNRLMVLIDWAWDYFLYDRGVRLITPREEPRD